MTVVSGGGGFCRLPEWVGYSLWSVRRKLSKNQITSDSEQSRKKKLYKILFDQ